MISAVLYNLAPNVGRDTFTVEHSGNVTGRLGEIHLDSAEHCWEEVSSQQPACASSGNFYFSVKLLNPPERKNRQGESNFLFFQSGISLVLLSLVKERYSPECFSSAECLSLEKQEKDIFLLPTKCWAKSISMKVGHCPF